MVKTCLMLKTKDKRKFLTHKKNLPMLREFVNTFGAEVCLVEVDAKLKPEILELKALAPALCDANYNSDTKCRVIEKVLPKSKRRRQDILKNAVKIQAYIRKRMLSGKSVSLKELKTKYADLKFTDACLCNHLSQVRTQLLREGHAIEKLGAGKYRVSDLY